MASPVIMPKMGYDMTEGVVTRWLKHPGDEVAKGEPIAEIETDKVTIEIEAFAGGKLEKLLVEEGARVPVGQPIAEIDTGEVAPDLTQMQPVGSGEGHEAVPESQQAIGGRAVCGGQRTGPSASRGLEKSIPSRAEEERRTAAQAGGPMPGGAYEPPAPRERGERIKASPLARRLAADAGLPLAELHGTGPGGRIVRADVEAALHAPTKAPALAPPAAPHPAAGGRTLNRSQLAVARVMTGSKTTIPHFYVTMAIEMDAATDLREEMNETLGESNRISVNDMIVKATALALRETPELTHFWRDDGQLTPAPGIHVSIAVAVDGSIISPVVHDADRMPLPLIARRSRQLIQDARAGKLSGESLQGGIFTVSNLGAYGVDEFVAIITPPQTGVLAVGAMLEVPIVYEGEIFPSKQMKLTLSADHRLAGGVQGAEFLQRVKKRLENPIRLLVDEPKEA